MMAASLETFGRIWSATARHCTLAASGVSWAKAVAMKAETTPPPALAGMGEHVAHEVDAATLPGGAEHLGDGGLDAFMGIGDDELDATQPPARQLAQELRPDRLGLRGADLHAQHLAPSVAVDADGDDDGDRHDAPPATDLQVGGVDPQIRPVAFDRPLPGRPSPCRRSPRTTG